MINQRWTNEKILDDRQDEEGAEGDTSLTKALAIGLEDGVFLQLRLGFRPFFFVFDGGDLGENLFSLFLHRLRVLHLAANDQYE